MPVVDGNWFIPDHAWPRNAEGGIPIRITKGRGGEDVFLEEDIQNLLQIPMYQLIVARGIAMDIEQNVVEVSGAAEGALKSLKALLDKFKSTIGNDLTSIKSASARVQSETIQMKQAYQAAQSMLTTPEFERAVANAERMAVALKAISELSETKLSVAVFSGGPSNKD